VSMAHYDRTALPDSLTILAAGVTARPQAHGFPF
jgi:hypothetical protein